MRGETPFSPRALTEPCLEGSELPSVQEPLQSLALKALSSLQPNKTSSASFSPTKLKEESCDLVGESIVMIGSALRVLMSAYSTFIPISVDAGCPS